MRRLLAVFIIGLSFLNLAIVFSPQRASAAVAEGCDGSTSFLGFPTWYKYLDIGPEHNEDGVMVDDCAIIGPVQTGGENAGKIDWQAASGRIGLAVIEILLRVATLIAVGYVVYGGFRYITSQGDPESAKSARQTIINAVIGLVISLIATGAVAFIGNEFGSTTTTAVPAEMQISGSGGGTELRV